MTRATRVVLPVVLFSLSVVGVVVTRADAAQAPQTVDPMNRHYLNSAKFWLGWIQQDTTLPPDLKTRVGELERDFAVVERAYNRVAPDAPAQTDPAGANDPHWSEAAERIDRVTSAIIESSGIENFRLHKFESFLEQFNNFLGLARPLLPPPPASAR